MLSRSCLVGFVDLCSFGKLVVVLLALILLRLTRVCEHVKFISCNNSVSGICSGDHA